MSDNPMDKLPAHNRVSIRAVLVHEGEDESAALAEAGFVNSVAIPVAMGEQPDLSGGILGNGITPNLVAVLEEEQEEDGSDDSSDSQPDTAGSGQGDGRPSGSAATKLPAAYGMQPLAPVRPDSGTRGIAKRAAGAPPNPSAFPGAANSSPSTQPATDWTATDDAQPPEPVAGASTEPSGIQTAAPGGQPIAAGQNENTSPVGQNENTPPVPPQVSNRTPVPEATQAGNSAPSRVVDVAAPPPQTTAPMPFVDDKGQGYLNSWGEPMLRPAGLDPHFFVDQGLKDKQAEEELRSSGSEEGVIAALAYQTAALAHFRRGGPWDAQRLGGSDHPEFVDYSTVAIGLYAAANGMPRAKTLEVEDLVARRSHFRGDPEKDKIYTHLPVRNVRNTDLGYQLFQSGKIAATSKP
jgi:hypothetical protein